MDVSDSTSAGLSAFDAALANGVAVGAAPHADEELLSLVGPKGDPWEAGFRQNLERQHTRVRQFLEEQHERWAATERRLLAEIECLAEESRALRAQCSRQEESSLEASTAASTAASDGEEAAEDLRRRYAMALDDLRELRTKNNALESRVGELQKQAPARDGRPAASPQRSGALDWEAEKLRILAALESESAEESPVAAKERLAIEEVVRRTDQLLAEKDREIFDLQQLLQHQSENLGAVAVGAAAVGQLFDQDEIIVEQRDNLKRLQDECRAKLRQAEVEISQERAKLARQQAEVASQLQELRARTGRAEETEDSLSSTGRPVRGRWLARLGLSEKEEPRK